MYTGFKNLKYVFLCTKYYFASLPLIKFNIAIAYYKTNSNTYKIDISDWIY